MIRTYAKKTTVYFLKAACALAALYAAYSAAPVYAADPVPGANLDIITIKDRLAKKYRTTSVNGRVAADGRLFEIEMRGVLLRAPRITEHSPIEDLDEISRKLILDENWLFGMRNPEYDAKLDPAKTSRSGNKIVLTYKFYIAAVEIEDREIEFTYIGSELIRLYSRIANYSPALRAAANKSDTFAIRERADALRIYFEDKRDPTYPNISPLVLRGIETKKLASDNPPYFIWIVSGLGFHYRINAFTGEILSRTAP